MKDDPFDVMPAWQIALYCLYVVAVTPIVTFAAAALTPVTRRWAKPPRVACGNCGRRMPAIERHCPECRAAR
jgi:hypothetical protein